MEIEIYFSHCQDYYGFSKCIEKKNLTIDIKKVTILTMNKFNILTRTFNHQTYPSTTQSVSGQLAVEQSGVSPVGVAA